MLTRFCLSRILVSAACITLFIACGASSASFEQIKTEAGACKTDDVCVLAGGNRCSCDVPVNEKKADDVRAAAACGNAVVKCATFLSPRCEDNKCVGDLPGRCTVGQDQTCNDDPAISSIHGTCEANGVCTCSAGFKKNFETGKCL